MGKVITSMLVVGGTSLGVAGGIEVYQGLMEDREKAVAEANYALGCTSLLDEMRTTNVLELGTEEQGCAESVSDLSAYAHPTYVFVSLESPVAGQDRIGMGPVDVPTSSPQELVDAALEQSEAAQKNLDGLEDTGRNIIYGGIALAAALIGGVGSVVAFRHKNRNSEIDSEPVETQLSTVESPSASLPESESEEKQTRLARLGAFLRRVVSPELTPPEAGDDKDESKSK